MSPITSLADDLLRGCKSIAGFIGLSERDCFEKLLRGYIPATKEGAIWVASKARLRAHYGVPAGLPAAEPTATPPELASPLAPGAAAPITARPPPLGTTRRRRRKPASTQRHPARLGKQRGRQ